MAGFQVSSLLKESTYNNSSYIDFNSLMDICQKWEEFIKGKMFFFLKQTVNTQWSKEYVHCNINIKFN